MLLAVHTVSKVWKRLMDTVMNRVKKALVEFVVHHTFAAKTMTAPCMVTDGATWVLTVPVLARKFL
jgi:hypothetical protein